MITRKAGEGVERVSSAAPASRIVRIAAAMWPALAAATVLAAATLATPHEAWLPLAHGPATAADWTRLTDGWMAWLSRLQIGLGGRAWPGDPVRGGIAAAAAFGAAAAWSLAAALPATGLRPAVAGLLALVAAAAPLAAWHSASPLGAAPAAAASAMVLWWLARAAGRVPVSATPDPVAPHRRNRATWRMALLLAALVLLREWLAPGPGASTTAETMRLLGGDLGLTGVVLLLLSVGLSAHGMASRSWLGLTAIGLLSAPMPAHVRAAAMLPWAWWLAGAGLTGLLAWRGRLSYRWTAAALVGWGALQVAPIPWGHQRQQAALVRTWADGVVARLDAAHVLVHEASARGALLAALARSRRDADFPAVVEPHEAYRTALAGRRALVTSPDSFEALRWGGLAWDTWQDDHGVAVDGLLDALPHGTVVLAAFSGEAAALLTPTQWQALARAGLRLADAGTGRAHVLAGVTGARVEALEAVQVGSVRLDVQPGDQLGRTGVRSPTDVRLDADQTTATITLRGESLPTGDAAMVVVLLNRRGDVLGWRSGPNPQHLDGPALGLASPTRAVSVAALPCVELSPNRQADIASLMSFGALGVSWQSAASVEVALSRPAGRSGLGVRLAGMASLDPPVLTPSPTAPDTFALQASRAAAAGVYLRGPVDAGRATTDGPVRVCAAWPMSKAIDVSGGPVAFLMSPGEEPHHGFGWHDSEFESGRGFFRWMAGPRAELLVALRTNTPMTVSLDAQAPHLPTPSDLVALSVNGRDIGARPLLPTRGIYAWQIDAADLRQGVNTLALVTTQSTRPADRRAGADPRMLGLLIRGWTLVPRQTRPPL